MTAEPVRRGLRSPCGGTGLLRIGLDFDGSSTQKMGAERNMSHSKRGSDPFDRHRKDHRGRTALLALALGLCALSWWAVISLISRMI